MDVDEEQGGVREAVGVFHKVEDFQAAIDELLSSGFDRAELSLLASEHAVAAKLGKTSFRETDLEDNPAIPRAVYVSPAAMGAAEGGSSAHLHMSEAWRPLASSLWPAAR
jgi:hypothetical protein